MVWPGHGRVPARLAQRDPAWPIGVWGRAASIRAGWAAGWRSGLTSCSTMTETTTGASPGRSPPGAWGVARSGAKTGLMVPISAACSPRPIPGVIPPVRLSRPAVAVMSRRCALPPPMPFRHAAAPQPFRHAAASRPSPGVQPRRILPVSRRCPWPPAPPPPELRLPLPRASPPLPRACPIEPHPGNLWLPLPIRSRGLMTPASPCRAGSDLFAPPDPRGRPMGQRPHRPDPWVAPCRAPPDAARRC